MEILDFEKEIDEEKLKLIGNKIREGKLAIFPTETVYGIGTNGLNREAVKKLYSVKQRDFNKPVSLLVSDIFMVEKLAINISDVEYKLMKAFFPGPFTIILKKSNIVPDIVTANKDTVGIRIPDCDITRKLIEYAGCPIAAPSANISGKPTGTNITEIINDFKEDVDYIINNGKSKIGIASTIVQVLDNVPHILREGIITKKDIEDVLK